MGKVKFKNIKAGELALKGGSVAGYFSTYDRTPDAYGDIVAPGAFAKTIEARKASGHPYPFCWNHDLNQIIGAVDMKSFADDERGPSMKADFLETPNAQEKRELAKAGVVYQFSFAYRVLDEGTVTLEDGTKANELREVELYEISLVPIPANQNAEVTDVKAGKRNSAKDEQLIRDAINALRQLLPDDDDTDDPDDGKDSGKGNAAAEDPEHRNSAKEALLERIKKNGLLEEMT